MKDAEQSANAKFQELRRDLYRQTVEQAVLAAEEIIRQKVSPDDQVRMVSEYVGKV
jgi:F0F1-type ATP synthase membrane subunit b/b'